MTTPGDPPPPGGLIDAAALQAMQERSRQRIQEVQARATRAKAALESETISATSRDRSVTVTVGPAGTLTGLTFGPAAAGVPLSRLSQTVLTTYGEATRQAVAQTETVVAELVGQDAPVLGLIRATAPVDPEGQR